MKKHWKLTLFSALAGYYLLLAIVFTSCGNSAPTTPEAPPAPSAHSIKVLANEYQNSASGMAYVSILEADSCQYVVVQYGEAISLVHKANCPNHRYDLSSGQPREVK